MSEKTVLVADDDTPIRELLHAILEDSFKVRVVHAAHGEEALQRCHEDLPSLVLLDIAMPVTNGFEVLRRLRADARTHDVPVVVVSEHPQYLDQARQLGANDAIAKPFDIDDIVERVRPYLADS